MWIRGQLRKGLVKADNFIIKETEKGFEITTVYSYCTIVHGIYSTQEKALKVLDMIQEHKERQRICIYRYDNCYLEDNTRLKTFIMPQDSEV